ncbi:MAG: tRNA (adenosine(37)-N6)-threonylcarbamoyltransferase complex ATPase subunit type 1 TsaE [Gallionellaceae bacterium]|jgi:tRNA threonylcarbamoyladenosine biosynthesis protein TsaE|nr:tRNA (adenosine(37)-N6)-threonylcarbamoyltransferase complex ATPase subunit type 1 TsaE [Gallionellaceae bacterium]
MSDHHSRISLPDEAATAAFAARLARALKPGMVIWLRGDLGAGKTTLARALLRALGYAGKVKSPTYTLMEPYEIGELQLRHFDLYRFQDEEEWEAAGFRDEFNERNICLIEWPEKAAEHVPQADVELFLTEAPQGRHLACRANTRMGRECLDSLPN